MPLEPREPPESFAAGESKGAASGSGTSPAAAAAGDQPDWHEPPEAADEPGGLSQAEMHRLAGRAEARPLWQEGYVSRHDDVRFAAGEGWRYFWKPMWMTLGLGIPACLLFIGQFWEPELNVALGSPFGRQDDLVRISMLLLGGFLLIAAAPLFKPAGWTPEKQRVIDRDKAYFRSKRRM